MPNVQLNKPGRSLKKAQAGIETTDNFIHSRYDDRYGEYDKLTKKQKALKEYQKWHDEVQEASLKSNADFIKLMKESDSLAYASNYLPELPVSEQVPLWTDPSTGKTVNKKRDMTPVDNPYTLDIAPLPWGENQEEEDAFRRWVNNNHPDKAKTWDFNRTASNLDNSYARSAYYELGKEYEDSRKPVTSQPVVVEDTPAVTTDNNIIMPGSNKEWVQTPTGTWYQKERASEGPKRNINTGGFEQRKFGGESLQRFIPQAQQGMEQPGMEQPGMSQQQLNPQQMQQQVMQMIEQALIQGADPRVIYSKLAKQLQGQIDPKMLNQMVSVVVDKINESMVLDPQDDVAAMQETMQEPQGNGMQMPSQNQMMTNQIMSEEMDESYLMDSAGTPPMAKRGGPVSKKKFISNVLKLAKKQMGGADNAKGKQTASIRDTAQFDRNSVKANFMTGVNEASKIANIKNQAEQQYDMMQQQEDQQMMQQFAQLGGFVDGDLKKFCGGGMRKAQRGDVGNNIEMLTEVLGEEQNMVDPNVPNYVKKGRSYHYKPNDYLSKLGTDEVTQSYGRTIGDFFYDVLHPNKGPRVSMSFKKGGERREPIVGETWDTWYTSNGSTPGGTVLGDITFAPNKTVWNGSEWVSDYDPTAIESLEDKEKRIREQIRRQELSDGVRGYTPQGKPIYPGIFDKEAFSRGRGFSDLYPFNKAIDYIGSYGEMSNAQLNGQPYTGGINNKDLIRSEVTKKSIFGRPKEWTNYYTEDYIIDPDKPNAPEGTFSQAAINEGTPQPNRRGRFSRSDTENMTVEQKRDAIDAGYNVADDSNIFQNMWNKMRQGKPDQIKYGGLTKYQIDGEVQLSEGYETPAWNDAFQNESAPTNLDAPVQPIQYEVNENMGGEGTPFNDEISVKNKRKDMYNIDFESGVQQFNAAANFGIGGLERRADRSLTNWGYDQLNADNLYGQTRKRKLGDWDQLGNFRPDQQGFRGVAQEGGQQPQSGSDPMQQVMQMTQQMMQEGAEPVQIVETLVQQGVPPEAVSQVLIEMGIPEDQIQQIMQQVMQQGQSNMANGGMIGDEMYMSEEDIQDYLESGGELEFI